MTFSLSNIISLPLSHPNSKLYEDEVSLLADFIESTTILGNMHPRAGKKLRAAQKALDILDTLEGCESALETILSFRTCKKRAKWICDAILVPFSCISLMELVEEISELDLVKKLMNKIGPQASKMTPSKNFFISDSKNFMLEIFTNIPIFGKLKFAGIPRITFLALHCLNLYFTNEKIMKLEKKKTKNLCSANLSEEGEILKVTIDNSKNINKNIKLKHFYKIKKIIKISFSSFFLGADLMGVSIPGKTTIKASLVGVDLMLSSYQYYLKKAG